MEGKVGSLMQKITISSWHISMAGMDECNHGAAVMFQVEAAVRKSSKLASKLANPSCTSSANEWLPCRKDHEPTLFGYVYLLRQKRKMFCIWI